jgi:Restriction endonuclease NotI
MAKPQRKQKDAIRHFIGELYGRDFSALAPQEMRSLALPPNGEPLDQPCRFRGGRCNKKGGVCSLRQYKKTDTGVEPTGGIITTCPERFKEDLMVFRWVAETLIHTQNPTLVSEVPFLKGEQANVRKKKRDTKGRIDLVLVKDDVSSGEWCCLEAQAVYFSGRRMELDFRVMREWQGPGIPFPVINRRPDWRSSSAKRLLPQLQAKVPAIRRWGVKMAVVVDNAFWNSIGGIKDQTDLSNSDLIWFVVDYEPSFLGFKLQKKGVYLTTIEDAVTALTGGVPVTRKEFEDRVAEKMSRTTKGLSLSAVRSSFGDELISSRLDVSEADDSEPEP